MRAVLNRWILAVALVPATVQAQSITPTQTTLRLFGQTSASVLSAEKRLYTFYFNTLRTRYIAVEATVEYAPAATAFRLAIACQMTSPDGRTTTDGIWKIGADVTAGSTRAVGANLMFGAGKDGWQTGLYKVTCSSGGPLGETAFQMSPGPSLLGDSELRLKEVRFFPTGAQVTPQPQRNYQDSFSATEATRIGIELSFVHPGLTKSGDVPVDCYYLSSIGTVFGTLSFVYSLKPPAASGSGAMGIGWDEPGHWARGNYLAICQIHGRPISVDRFSVR
jgi:hypothetical protein